MMEWMLMPLKRYADFSGRSRRKEYWMFQLFSILCILGALLLGGILSIVSNTLGGLVIGLGYLGVVFGFFIPALAVAVRRMHDQDKSGWFILIPFLNFLMLFFEGTRGTNRFGPDPKDENAPDIFV
jgi:uncharacterized membrane protein YhaH (DUF805 family)